MRAGRLAWWLAVDLRPLLGVGVVETRIVDHAVHFRVKLLPRTTGVVRGLAVLLTGSI